VYRRVERDQGPYPEKRLYISAERFASESGVPPFTPKKKRCPFASQASRSTAASAREIFI
jgi:hypothetical protein